MIFTADAGMFPSIPQPTDYKLRCESADDAFPARSGQRKAGNNRSSVAAGTQFRVESYWFSSLFLPGRIVYNVFPDSINSLNVCCSRGRCGEGIPISAEMKFARNFPRSMVVLIWETRVSRA